jgi:hypothetical protein
MAATEAKEAKVEVEAVKAEDAGLKPISDADVNAFLTDGKMPKKPFRLDARTGQWVEAE